MEYIIKEVIRNGDKRITVSRGKKNYKDYPSKFDEITIQVGEKQVKAEIVHIENNTIFVEKITS